ncbi:hypothetical protein RCH05_002343, partial [Janthinobacterium sp. CAN_S7]
PTRLLDGSLLLNLGGLGSDPSSLPLGLANLLALINHAKTFN